jgi:membrane protein YqaA with SNARE-associated domain
LAPDGISLSDLAVYAGLFLSAFTSATLLPGSSEAALLALLAAGRGEVVLLVLAATAGNVLGSSVNWILGRFFSTFRERRWFPVTAQSYDRAAAWYRRYGAWSLLLSVDWLRFLVLVSLGKAGRYIFLAAAFHWWSG